MKRLLYIIVPLISMGVGFCFGLCVKNWPILKFNPHIAVTDVFTILLTIALAILVPFFIKYFIDRSEKVNNVVFGEIELYRDELGSTQDRFVEFYQGKSISQENKLELGVWTEILDKKFESLEKVLKSQCGDSIKEETERLKENQIKLWRLLTGTKISNPNYTEIDYHLFHAVIESYQAIQENITNINLNLT